MKNQARRRLLLHGLAVTSSLAVWQAPGLYRAHVEREFEVFTENSLAGEPFQVLESRCVGKQSERIRLRPIAVSTFTGSYPYIDEILGPRDRAYMEFVYYHGYSFNYCKKVRIDEREFIAYWSLKQDRWHMGSFERIDRRHVWVSYRE